MWDKTVLLLLSIFCVSIQAQKDPHFVENRNTIVHLFEWRYETIALECEQFLSQNGYGGVQISPPSENVILGSRPWWERYQPVSYILSTRSGDEKELADMLKRCNAVGVRVYADILLNDMAKDEGTGTAGTTFTPNTKNYPGVPYTAENFHESCDVTDFFNATNVRDCELDGLPDLDQSQDHVRQMIIGYLNHLIDLGIAGFRVDAAEHISPEDLEYIFTALNDLNTEHGFQNGARAYVYQEFVTTNPTIIKASEFTGYGIVTEFKYGAYLSNCFHGNNLLMYLTNWGTEWDLLEGQDALAFIENHDNQRVDGSTILTYKESKPYKAAVAFMLAHPYEASTRIMSSYYFDEYSQGPPADADGNIIPAGFNSDNTCTNGWVCEHRWREIFAMINFRDTVAGTELTNWWSGGDNQIAFSRGNKGFIAITIQGDINASIPTGLPAGKYCDVISADVINGACTGKTITVDSTGNAQVSLLESDFDAVLVIHEGSKGA